MVMAPHVTQHPSQLEPRWSLPTVAMTPLAAAAAGWPRAAMQSAGQPTCPSSEAAGEPHPFPRNHPAMSSNTHALWHGPPIATRCRPSPTTSCRSTARFTPRALPCRLPTSSPPSPSAGCRTRPPFRRRRVCHVCPAAQPTAAAATSTAAPTTATATVAPPVAAAPTAVAPPAGAAATAATRVGVTPTIQAGMRHAIVRADAVRQADYH